MKKYKIEVDCANCANELANEISKIKGIKRCEINFTFKEMSVDFEDGVDEKSIMEDARKIAHDLDDDFEIYI